MKSAILFLTLILSSSYLYGQEKNQIKIPDFKDDYSLFVKGLEFGKTDIDYRKFRESFITSKQFIIASKETKHLQELKKQMYSQMESKQYQDVINTSQKILSINYTNMLAHKALRQSYKILGDTASASKYKSIQFGLLKSIIDSGDGKTCATAWAVTQIDEEYFILQMVGAELLEQSIDKAGGLCDKMDVRTEDGKKATYYFETSKVFEGYNTLMK